MGLILPCYAENALPEVLPASEQGGKSRAALPRSWPPSV